MFDLSTCKWEAIEGPTKWHVGVIRCSIELPGGTYSYQQAISSDYALMKDTYEYFWYILARVAHAIALRVEEHKRLEDYEWWKRNSSMFA